jgi:phage terminase large subunit-like protein
MGTFPDLESEMTTWRPGDGWSPNRLDALVWAITELEVEAQSTGVRLHGQALAGLSVPHAI